MAPEPTLTTGPAAAYVGVGEQTLGGLAKEPGAFNVVAKSVGVRKHLPIFIEEVMEMEGACIQDYRETPG